MRFPREKMMGALRAMPEEISDLFSAPETSETIWGIADKYGLNDKQKVALVDATSEILLRLEPIENFIGNITSDLGIETGKAISIKDSVSSLVLSKFEALGLKFVHSGNNSGQTSNTNQQSALVSQETVQKALYEISQKWSLNEKQRQLLEIQINNVLEKRTPINSFRANLVQELDLTYDQALKISLDANIAIFGPVMETLKNAEQGIRATQGPASVETKSRPSSGAEDILRAQVDRKPPANLPTAESSTTTPAAQTTPKVPPLLMDHDEMERVDGVHLHSQSVMPAAGNMSSRQTNPPRTNPQNTAPASSSPITPPTPTRSSFRSIVDEKLSSLVRSTNDSARSAAAPTTETLPEKPVAPEKPKTYAGNDPYREPLQ